MATKTYTMQVPAELYAFCAAYAKVYNAARKSFLERVLAGEKDTELVKQFQPLYGLSKRQVNSIRAEVKGAIASAKECRTRHIRTLEGQLKSVREDIKRTEKRLKEGRIPNACSLVTIQPLIWQAWQKLHQKKRRVYLLEKKLKHIKEAPLKISLPTSNTDFFFVGSNDETAGNQICQLTEDGKIKIRVPAKLESIFGEYVYTSGLTFPYGQQDINAALEVFRNEKGNKVTRSALSFRFYCRNFIWYAAVTVDVPYVPTQSRPRRKVGCIGVDLNPGVIGWAYVDANGNLKDKGQFKLNLHSLASNQTEALLSDTAAQLVLIAETFEAPIVVENLDFSVKKHQLRERGRKYARMLSGFAYSKWNEVMDARCNNRGIELIKVNPAYSSLIGLVKFMRMYGLSSDTAAAMALARRAMWLSERLPAKSAYLFDYRKHVWSHWYELNKELSRFPRHSFYTTGANSPLEVILPDLALARLSEKRKCSKRKRTSSTG